MDDIPPILPIWDPVRTGKDTRRSVPAERIDRVDLAEARNDRCPRQDKIIGNLRNGDSRSGCRSHLGDKVAEKIDEGLLPAEVKHRTPHVEQRGCEGYSTMAVKSADHAVGVGSGKHGIVTDGDNRSKPRRFEAQILICRFADRAPEHQEEAFSAAGQGETKRCGRPNVLAVASRVRR
ncbi:hypothetical protein [Microvirga sp. HBU67558]|uniref:hypothetical protein n=1 Tax=Microvirga sp. HBU67558 TaxID=2824562 RepID=UPI001FFC54DC|nr:hypothetical protein [Microvirga sp. HBU67558]